MIRSLRVECNRCYIKRVVLAGNNILEAKMAKKSSDDDEAKRPPDGLISQLRNTAGLLMHSLCRAQKHNMDAKRTFSWWPVDPNQMEGERIAMPKDMPSIDSKDSPAIPELKPICNILRRQASSFVEDVLISDRPVGEDGFRYGPSKSHYEKIRFYDAYDDADLDALKDAFNLPVTEIASGPIDHAVYRPWYLMLVGNPLRILADTLMDFTFMLVQNYGILSKRPVYGLHEYNPIAVCKHCNGLFLRTRADGQFCSKKCGASHWRLDRKEYLRKYQAKWRAGLKAETAKLKKKLGDDKPRRSRAAKKKQARKRGKK
jgi:hypothetical protein